MSGSPGIRWPTSYSSPQDLKKIERVPLSDRHLPPTTYELLRGSAEAWPDRIALSVLPGGTDWDRPSDKTFAQLLEEVVGFANALHRRGIRRGDSVALISPNCAPLITATLAAQVAGIAAPINGGLSTQHIHHLLELSGARVLVAAGPSLDSQIWETCCELAAAGRLDTVVVLGRTADEDVEGPLVDLPGVEVIGATEFASALPADHFVGEPPTQADVSALFHTGGTTGLPKLAAHTHANEVANAWMIAANTTLHDEDTVLAALPLFHVNALIVTLLAPLMRGQRSLWAGPLGYRDPELMRSFWRIVAHHGINSMSAVPSVYGALARVPVDADITSMRFAIVGASTLPPGVRAAFQRATRVPLVEGYGLTEATCASARAFDGATPPGAVGQRLAYQQIKAVDIDGEGSWRDLAPGRAGNLVTSGPTVFAGYVQGTGARGLSLDGMGKLDQGWLDTGDLGFVDDDDFVHLTGRAKDLIIRGGHNIDPRVIEDALLMHPLVSGASAVGRPDRRAGEVPVAYVTLDAAITEHDLLAWAAENVSERAAVPKSIYAVDALPMTAVGKPYKLELRADATRRAVTHALGGILGPEFIAVDIEDGSILVTLTVNRDVQDSALRECLDSFAVAWRMVTNQSTGRFG